MSHGYDIVTNKGYFDKDPAQLAPARTVPKPTHWESLNHSSNHFWQNRTMATQSRLAARPKSEGASSRYPAMPALDILRAREQTGAALEMTAGSSVRTGGFR